MVPEAEILTEKLSMRTRFLAQVVFDTVRTDSAGHGPMCGEARPCIGDVLTEGA